MKIVTKKILIHSTPEKAFQVLDDLGITGMHMTKSSAMMLGSKLNLEFITAHHKGLGSKYRWSGKMLGMRMDFTVEVTKWVEGKEKIWKTIGAPQLIIFESYEMHLKIFEKPEGTETTLSISYERPKPFFYKILSWLFADLYCKWCLNNMLRDSKKSLEINSNEKH